MESKHEGGIMESTARVRGTADAVQGSLMDSISALVAERRAREHSDRRDGRAARERATFERSAACVECGETDGRTMCGALTCHDCAERADGEAVS